MADSKTGAPPRFDHGVFLLHYNRGREAFQEGRYGEARLELESAQRLRPEDPDVLNLLGLVYFKTSAFPEAEVIYRRLVSDNPNVFILHSNLGLILFKQGKGDEAEKYLLRSVELRPNYAKSHQYLGMLYRQKKKLGLALEHLQFAGAEKLVREVQAEMRGGVTPAVAVTPAVTAPVPAIAPPPAKPSTPATTMPGTALPSSVERPYTAQAGKQPIPAAPEGSQSASRSLQDVVDESPQVQDRKIDLGRRIEGASRTFALHENGFLEINFHRSVHVKRGTVSSYSGNLKFATETGLAGTTAAALVKADGDGKLFLYEKGRKTFLLDLDDEFIYVEGSHLLAVEDSLTFRVESIYDSAYQRKIDAVKIFGKGSVAISTSIEPLTLRVTQDFPLSISSVALVAWTGSIIPTVLDDAHLEQVMIEAALQSFRIRFEGDGIVVSEQ
ncbi:MAG TPA: tetratricopeptide repeat protein [Thermoanaerobaculia bacterium]|nr:tetratricopeptide repeat protein [Thermoanaerobaculia bacterium]